MTVPSRCPACLPLPTYQTGQLEHLFLCEVYRFILPSAPAVAPRAGFAFLFFFKILFIYFYREGKGGRKRGKHQCVVASCTPPTGYLAATQACALTGNRTSDPLVCRLALNPLSHTSQGQSLPFCSLNIFFPHLVTTPSPPSLPLPLLSFLYSGRNLITLFS